LNFRSKIYLQLITHVIVLISG